MSTDALAVDPHADTAGVEDDDDLASETTSVQSSIYKYRYENGRRYHASNNDVGSGYWGPNDEKASEHLDIAHNLWLKTLDDKLTLAPLPEKIEKVLDVGCGTGTWAIDFAESHPTTTVLGTDISPAQTPPWAPPNCAFEISDANAYPWPFAAGTFDLVHVRSLFGCVSDWPAFYRECARVLKPGGYVEHVEMGRLFKSPDNSLPADAALVQLDDFGRRACEAIGKPGDVVYRMRGWLEEGGWEGVVQREYAWPTGPWPRDPWMKEVGRWSRLHLVEGVENWCLAMLTRVLGFSYEEAMAWIERVKREVRDPRIHAYHDMFVCYARKPVAARSK
ncbi:putative sam dependent methyltransferase protein [Lasiodiplodia theobromae]|nr:putative sam dependent methyltransferase protein [Lasiodiplodia theobromae]